MEKVKTVGEYTIYKKRSGRYGVQDAKRQWVHGEAKVKTLLEAKLIKLTAPKKKAEPKAEAAPETPAAS